jgi:hypothetical protein
MHLRLRAGAFAEYFTYSRPGTRQHGYSKDCGYERPNCSARKYAGRSAPALRCQIHRTAQAHRALPFKGARDLENWCRAHPEYLNDLRLSERAQASLKLLEASGQSVDLREPEPPWWKHLYVLIGLGVLSLLCLIAFWALMGKYVLLRSELEDTKVRMHQGSLVQPATQTSLSVAPDHAPGIDRARVAVSRSAPQLMDLHIDLSYSKAMQFRMVVDKQDQGRALILNNLLKDSNNELRLTLNTSGLAAGIYMVRIEALPPRGTPIPEGWLILEVH